MSVYRQNEDGTWGAAQPIGWAEEHNRLVRLLYWLARIPHCNDEAHGRALDRRVALQLTCPGDGCPGCRGCLTGSCGASEDRP